MNLNRVESRQKASVMFEPFRVTAMGTPRSWTKDMFQVWQLPRHLAFFWMSD